MDEFKKKDDETLEEYGLRIGTACDERRLTWERAAEYLNDATGYENGECACSGRACRF